MNIKSKYFPLYLFIILLLSACSGEETLYSDKSGKIIEIEISNIIVQDKDSRSSLTSVMEDQLNSLWLSFYDKTSGLRIGQSYDFSSSSIINNKVKIINYDSYLLNKKVDVVVVTNPDESMMTQLKNCGTRNGLDKLKTTAYTAAFPTYACMYGKVEHTFTDSDLKANVSLVRLPAKVEIICSKDKTKNITILSYAWENIPIESFLIENQRGMSDMSRGDIATDALQDERGLGYPYEYAKGSQRGKVKIRAQKDDGTICYYYFLLPEEIKRNHWYKFKVTPVGEGGTEEKPEEIQTTLEVKPWTEVDSNINIGDVYLECPKDFNLYVRTQGIVVNNERSFIFHTNVSLNECKISTDNDLLICNIVYIPGGGRINFKVKKGVFYEFHPRVKTFITLTAGNISRKVDITLIPLMEIHPQRPNVIMVWPGHEFYYNSAKHGGLYIHTPFTPEGYANNQQEEPNMCQKIEIYNQDNCLPNINGQEYCHANYSGYNENHVWIDYYEDFCSYWNKLNGCKRFSSIRENKSCAEILGNGWRCPTEYELRAMYQAWAHFGRPGDQGGNDTPPKDYKTQEEKDLYNKARIFYKRFSSYDPNRPYGCTTYKEKNQTTAQHFMYVNEGNTWVANKFLIEYSTDKTIIIRPVRDYAGSEKRYEENTWSDKADEAKNNRR